MDISPFQPLKLLRHGDKVQQMLEGKPVYPISVELDLSNTCNHGCAWCSFGTEESGGYRQTNWVQFPTARAILLLEELAECGVQSITFTGGGEPLVHRAAAALFEKCAALGLAFGVVTNGVGLRGAAQAQIAQHATFVRVSLDAGSGETHQITHRTAKPEFHSILDNLLHTRTKAGDRALTIGASFCVQRVNWKEIYQAAQAVKEHGGNYLEVRPTFPTDWRGDGWNEALTDDEVDAAKAEISHAKAHLDDASFRIIGMVQRFDAIAKPEKGYRKCQIGPLMTVIGADQNLWHCCVQRGQEFFNMGTLVDTSFKDAWAKALERKMADQIDVSQCPRCRYDGFNAVIEEAFVEDGMHYRFT
jgi:MoaA/NifB/PqqE/SkfB family radical SAM enzyme